jgi:hypothetical protein
MVNYRIYRTIAAQSRRYPQLRGFEINSMPAICDVWRVPPAESKENEPITSNIPTLILAGEYDAYILPAWGQPTAQTLRNSYYYEVPGRDMDRVSLADARSELLFSLKRKVLYNVGNIISRRLSCG